MLTLALLLLAWTGQIKAEKCTTSVLFGSSKRLTCDGITSTEELFREAAPAATENTSIYEWQIKNSNFDTFKVFNITNLLFDFSVESSSIAHFPSKAFEELPLLEDIKLIDNNVKKWEKPLFSGLNNLQVLKIKGYNLKTIQLDLSRLLTLDLSENSLEVVQENDFKLSRVNSLNLSHNSLSQIEPLAFKSCQNLQDLHLDHNNLTTVDKKSFIGLNSIISINLDSNSINEIPLFEGLETLQELHLENNLIKKVENLGSLKNLKYINLGNNKIVTLPETAFSNLQLFELHLSHNSIEEITEKVFQNFEYISLIDLGWNKIKSIHPNAFKLSSLIHLHLEGNQLENVNFDSKVLKSLDLSYNKIKKIQKYDLILPKLSNLNLSFNEIDLWDSNQTLSSLTDCDLSHNNLERISKEMFGGFNDLYRLYLDYNKIEEVNFENIDHLSILSLSYNQISVLNLNGVNNLKEINLKSNLLQDFTYNFANSTALNIDDNNLSKEKLDALYKQYEKLTAK